MITRNFSNSLEPRIWAFAAFFLVAMVCLYVSYVPLAGIDFWMQAKIGNVILAEGAIPHTLRFPFTEIAEQTFNAHEWLCSIFFYWVLSVFGAAKMPLITAILGLLYFSLAVRLGYLRSGSNLAVSLIGGIAAIATQNYRHTLRPELIGMVLMAAYWVSLEGFRQRPNFLAGVITTALMITWEGVHGSFVLAPVMATLYLAGAHIDNMMRSRSFTVGASREVVALAALCAVLWLACFANPFGAELIRFVIGFTKEAKSSYGILEWTPTFSLRNLSDAGFWLGALVWGFTLVTMWLNRRRVGAIDVLIFIFFTLLSTKAIRFPIYLGLVSAYICGSCMPPSSKVGFQQKRIYLLSMVLACMAYGGAAAYGNASGQYPYSPGPWKLSDEMTQTLSDPRYEGNVFNSMELGAELTYWAYPRLKPSIDCRIDSYGLDYVLFQKELLVNDALLTEFLDRYNVRYLLLERARIKQLADAGVLRQNRWKVIFQDRFAAFMERIDRVQ